MNEVETPTSAPMPSKRRWSRIWLVVLILGVAMWALLRTSQPERDPRLVGEWTSDSGLIRRYHADGRFDLLTSATGPVLVFGRPESWRTENGELIHFHHQSVNERLTRWLQNLFRQQTGVLRIGFGDERYQVLELTETTLKIQQIRQPPARSRPAEVFHRTAPDSHQ